MSHNRTITTRTLILSRRRQTSTDCLALPPTPRTIGFSLKVPRCHALLPQPQPPPPATVTNPTRNKPCTTHKPNGRHPQTMHDTQAYDAVGKYVCPNDTCGVTMGTCACPCACAHSQLPVQRTSTHARTHAHGHTPTTHTHGRARTHGHADTDTRTPIHALAH